MSLDRAAHDQLGAEAAEAFLSRVAERRDAVAGILRHLYGTDDLLDALLADVLDALAARPAPLRDLDVARAADPGWFLRPEVIGYVCYADRFAASLTGVGDHLDHLDSLGVRYLHLMPLLATRPGEDDGGYAVSDYDAVAPHLGTMADLSALADRLHERGMALCVDVAVNHTAREHEWARRAIAGDPHYRDFYLVFPDRTLPDEYERTTLDIFPRLAPGTFTFVPELDGWVWTSFREFQWDLNYANPDVFRAMLTTLLRLANRGPDVLRIDAAPFLWKRLGGTGLDEPEAHLILQAFRALTWMAAPGVLLKAEAMLDPDDVLRYLGTDDTPECDLAYDNQAMVLLWTSLALGDTRLATHALGRRRPPPARATWVTYVRCHDDIGWAIDDADAAATGYDGRELRARVSAWFAGHGGEVFQPNATGAHPISGMAATLCGAPDDPLALRRLETLYSVAFSVGGIPLVYMGDELALPSDEAWAEDPAHHGDNRWLHRPRMRWPAGGPVLDRFRALAQARCTTPELHANAPLRLLDADPRVLAYTRGERGAFLAVANVSADEIPLGPIVEAAGIADPETVHATDADVSAIPPAGFTWLRDRRRPA